LHGDNQLHAVKLELSEPGNRFKKIIQIVHLVGTTHSTPHLAAAEAGPVMRILDALLLDWDLQSRAASAAYEAQTA
jgi:hypothetical protein